VGDTSRPVSDGQKQHVARHPVFVFGARSVSVIVVLVMSAIHLVGDAIPQPAQAHQIMHRLERDLATNNYNDVYTLSIASLDISRAAYLSRCKISLILSRFHTHPLALFHTSWAGFFTRVGPIRRRYHTSWADPHAADERGEGNDTSSLAVGKSGAG